MSRNDEVNALIRQAIDNEKEAIFSCKGSNDPEVLTYDGIILDGDHVPDLLFLLKEANDGRDSGKKNKPDFSEGFDFVSHAREEAKKQSGEKPIHWDNLCYWTKAYNDAVQKKPQYFLDSSVQNCGGLLGQVSLVNIKKAPGARVTDGDSFIHTVTNTACAELVRNEISLIAPKIVVCCGTYEYAKELYHEYCIAEVQLACGANYFIHEKTFFLEFIHPTQYGAAAKRCLTYAYAKEVFKDLIDNGLKENDTIEKV